MMRITTRMRINGGPTDDDKKRQKEAVKAIVAEVDDADNSSEGLIQLIHT